MMVTFLFFANFVNPVCFIGMLVSVPVCPFRKCWCCPTWRTWWCLCWPERRSMTSLGPTDVTSSGSTKQLRWARRWRSERMFKPLHRALKDRFRFIKVHDMTDARYFQIETLKCVSFTALFRPFECLTSRKGPTGRAVVCLPVTCVCSEFGAFLPCCDSGWWCVADGPYWRPPGDFNQTHQTAGTATPAICSEAHYVCNWSCE